MTTSAKTDETPLSYTIDAATTRIFALCSVGIFCVESGGDEGPAPGDIATLFEVIAELASEINQATDAQLNKLRKRS